MSASQLPLDWARSLIDLKDKHFQASKVFGKYHKRTGIPLVILAALANAAIWAAISDLVPNIEDILKLVLAIIGSVVTVLSAAQAFLGFDKRSEMHKNAAMKYSSLGADLEILMNSNKSIAEGELKNIKDKWSIITENSPILPDRYT